MFKPLFNNILVQRNDKEETTTGGIIMPDDNKEISTLGTVVAVGDGSINEKGQTIPTVLKVDDKIIFTQYAGTEIEIEDKKYIVLKDSDVLGIL
ncbi:MAG: co-chaperone GroES [Alphaproteobacteria bacterium]|nr:co-chaperone GroES [Alphaproteobacteria bacterium]MBL0717664.1 co-chaperone GroES [Alphaproteobacteria bacterium]